MTTRRHELQEELYEDDEDQDSGGRFDRTTPDVKRYLSESTMLELLNHMKLSNPIQERQYKTKRERMVTETLQVTEGDDGNHKYTHKRPSVSHTTVASNTRDEDDDQGERPANPHAKMLLVNEKTETFPFDSRPSLIRDNNMALVPYKSRNRVIKEAIANGVIRVMEEQRDRVVKSRASSTPRHDDDGDADDEHESPTRDNNGGDNAMHVDTVNVSDGRTRTAIYYDDAMHDDVSALSRSFPSSTSIAQGPESPTPVVPVSTTPYRVPKPHALRKS